MSYRKKAHSDEIIEDVVMMMKKQVGGSLQATLEKFIRKYYSNTAAEDLIDSEAANLYGAALAHWNFAHSRKAGNSKVRIYNPQFEEHGWQSTHTVVEIINDDMPFLVDSVRMALNARNLTTHLVIHPVINIRRDSSGKVVDILEHGDLAEGSQYEAIIHVEVDRQTEKEVLDAIANDVSSVLNEVSLAVEDWQPMCNELHQIVNDLKASPPPIDRKELNQSLDFLEWIGDDHFTFLGYREYKLTETDELLSVAGSGLGLLRSELPDQFSKSFASLPLEIRQLAREPSLLVITKASRRSTIHRTGYLDHIGIKLFDEQGNITGERRFMGMYTSAAYHNRPEEIPLLRDKMSYVMDRVGHKLGSHAAKSLVNIIETFPRDLLFQISNEDLYDSSMGILHLQERQRIRLFIHRDRYGRFYSCIVYVPRELFNTEVRKTIHSVLVEHLGGDGSEFNVQLSDSVLARLFFVLHVPPDSVTEYDVNEIEEKLREATRNWKDDLHDALLENFGEEQGMKLFRRYGDAFRANYSERYPPRTAIYDIKHMETLSEEGKHLAMSLYRPLETPDGLIRFKLFHLNSPVSLSDALPMLENMGLKVDEGHPSNILRADASSVWLHDFSMSYQGDWQIDLDQIKQKYQDNFALVWQGDVENDGFNRLVLRAKLDWREIVVLRAYSRYMRQAGTLFSSEYVVRALSFNHEIAALLIKLFHARFDPDQQQHSAEQCDKLVGIIETAMDEVESLDEDRILRYFLSLILATLRTNHYQLLEDGLPKSYLSFKFDPAKVPDLPEPRPMYEIFVYSPRVEGVHLRGGPVARGGLRWSDRREDFRTEVLGLVKAQMVKNAVIVPVGSKGGFFPKRLPLSSDREAFQAEGIACYKTFIRGLLDITDNLVAGEIAAPQRVVRYDGDDPYLVVAADKGTATFSDIANSISKEYGYWLGDAFASGGSQGYDHKAMGITARGAWESVKRHFRELGLNTQTEPFSVIGIGDMSGDVFGNGMLLSRQIKLVGAFNHLHIFLDPDPDQESSFIERQRLFQLPRSSWPDYQEKLISKGGGIYSRTSKSIKLTDEVRSLLGTDKSKMTPNELIQTMLLAPVDLLWNGGIGTYVKSTQEHHNDVGDRNNDAVRVDARALRCRVLGEGGNLGVTQLGRIEFAANGGRIYTDAIDNSAGVDCSDHEVNIKILMNEIVENQDMTEKQRNKQLADMTDEVGDLVLRDNYLQTQALSVAMVQSSQLLDVHTRLIRQMELDGELDREIEFLPDKEEIDERLSVGKGLTAPELSVLLAYVKINFFQQLLVTALPDDVFYGGLLTQYFPEPLRRRFSELMPNHRLCREIISTVVANEMVNRAGISFAYRLQEETGANAESIARAFTVAREIFAMPAVWQNIEDLDNVVPASTQIFMLLEGRKLVERASRWLLRNRPQPIDIASNVDYFTPGIKKLCAKLPSLLADSTLKAIQDKLTELTSQQVPEKLAQSMSMFGQLLSTLDIVEVANGLDLSVEQVASVYYALGEKLEFPWLHVQIVNLPRSDRWQALSRAALRDDLYNQHRQLTRDVLLLTDSKQEDAGQRVEQWMSLNTAPILRSRQILADLKTTGKADFAMLPVAMREIRGMSTINASQATAALDVGKTDKKVLKPKSGSNKKKAKAK
jgi:glutamate dehydrogenase